jgi:hypothetical protein
VENSGGKMSNDVPKSIREFMTVTLSAHVDRYDFNPEPLIRIGCY